MTGFISVAGTLEPGTRIACYNCEKPILIVVKRLEMGDIITESALQFEDGHKAEAGEAMVCPSCKAGYGHLLSDASRGIESRFIQRP